MGNNHTICYACEKITIDEDMVKGLCVYCRGLKPLEEKPDFQFCSKHPKRGYNAKKVQQCKLCDPETFKAMIRKEFRLQNPGEGVIICHCCGKDRGFPVYCKSCQRRADYFLTEANKRAE